MAYQHHRERRNGQTQHESGTFARPEHRPSTRETLPPYTNNASNMNPRLDRPRPDNRTASHNTDRTQRGAGSECTTVTVEDNRSDRQPKSKVARSWIPEILGAVLAIGLHIAIFVTLGIWNGRRSLTWPMPINLSALVATLSTISRISLGAIASEVISQTKWLWLGGSGGVPLHDLEAFDQASRGPFGAILLLKNGLRKPHLLLTLIMSLASIAMGPFTQQAVTTVPCNFVDNDGMATLPNIRTFGNLGMRLRQTWAFKNSTGLLAKADGTLNSATKAGLISTILEPSGKDSDVLPNCTTGNCTFPLLQDADGKTFTHRATGFCSLCLDISAAMTYLPNSTTIESAREAKNITTYYHRWILPGGQELSFNSATGHYDSLKYDLIPFLNISTSKDNFNFSSLPPSLPGLAEFRKVSDQSLVDITFISYNAVEVAGKHERNISEKSTSATVCSLYPCLRTYNASVQTGDLVESLVSTEPLNAYNDFLYPDRSDINDTIIQIQRGLFWNNTDAISVRPPCLVGEKLYTSENSSSAANAVTLSRWSRDLTEEEREFVRVEPSGAHNLSHLMVNVTAPPECLYAMELGGWWNELGQLYEKQVNGACYSSIGVTKQGLCSRKVGELSDDAIWIEGFANLRRRSQPELSTYMENVAKSMTQKFRMGIARTWGQNGTGNEWRPASEDVVGQVWRTTTCFAVDWRWLTFSTGLTAITVGILLWMVVCGMMRGDVVWKGSSLPVVYYRDRITVVGGKGGGRANQGLGAPEGEPLMGVGEMKANAKHVQVAFWG